MHRNMLKVHQIYVINFSRDISRVRILKKHVVSGNICPHQQVKSIPVSPDDGDRDSSRNVVFFKYPHAADSPRRFYYIMSPRKL
jgi:hypothetical protein